MVCRPKTALSERIALGTYSRILRFAQNDGEWIPLGSWKQSPVGVILSGVRAAKNLVPLAFALASRTGALPLN